MYESEHAVRIIHCGNRLQHEMANTFAPDRNTIAALCQEIENSAHEIYKWVNGIEGKSEQVYLHSRRPNRLERVHEKIQKAGRR